MGKLYGYDATLWGLIEAGVLGTAAAGNYRAFPFVSHALSGSVALEPSDVLGQGRDPVDPDEGAETAAGDVAVPVDLRHFGWWLTVLMGAPTTSDDKAYGAVQFVENPAAGDTVTLNGVVFTFVDGAPDAGEVERGGTLLASLTNLAVAANASVDADVSAATYSVGDGTRLDVVHDTAGAAGAAYTLAASAATVSGATLAATYRHVWESGAAEEDLHRATLVLKPKTGTGLIARQVSVFASSMRLALAAQGKATATFGCVAHSDEEVAAPDLGVAPAEWTYRRFVQSKATVTSGGAALAEVVSADLTYDNQITAVQTLGSGGRMGEVDLGMAQATGTLTARYRDGTLLNTAKAKTPIEVTFAYPLHPAARLELQLSRLWLPRPSRQITGPGGVEASYSFQGAKTSGGAPAPMLTATLLNDVAGYV